MFELHISSIAAVISIIGLSNASSMFKAQILTIFAAVVWVAATNGSSFPGRSTLLKRQGATLEPTDIPPQCTNICAPLFSAVQEGHPIDPVKRMNLRLTAYRNHIKYCVSSYWQWLRQWDKHRCRSDNDCDCDQAKRGIHAAAFKFYFDFRNFSCIVIRDVLIVAPGRMCHCLSTDVNSRGSGASVCPYYEDMDCPHEDGSLIVNASGVTGATLWEMRSLLAGMSGRRFVQWVSKDMSLRSCNNEEFTDLQQITWRVVSKASLDFDL
ncbi:hypothetical protein BU17DRAFT_59975 [Hysterangium stoloniferum]|nr:hypothetical protein BU17DRAFT_59975 [Hysterangium stoloniferum]